MKNSVQGGEKNSRRKKIHLICKRKKNWEGIVWNFASLHFSLTSENALKRYSKNRYFCKCSDILRFMHKSRRKKIDFMKISRIISNTMPSGNSTWKNWDLFSLLNLTELLSNTVKDEKRDNLCIINRLW